METMHVDETGGWMFGIGDSHYHERHGYSGLHNDSRDLRGFAGGA
jgi:hypothetical protein